MRQKNDAEVFRLIGEKDRSSISEISKSVLDVSFTVDIRLLFMAV